MLRHIGGARSLGDDVAHVDSDTKHDLLIRIVACVARFQPFLHCDGSFGFYIIDVSGHGVPAALLSVTLSHTLSPVSGRSWLLGREQSHDPNSAATAPAEVVTRLNEFFQMQPDSMQYFTMIYGMMDDEMMQHEIVFVVADSSYFAIL